MIITLDFETYYDDKYSLRKMTTEEYVRDPRFVCHGLAIKINDEPAQWWPAKFLHDHSLQATIENAAVLCHHAQFDGLILNHHFGIRPKLWLDTLSMARIALPHERHSLDNLGKLFGLGGKKHEHLTDVKGVREPNAQALAGLGTMSCDDADKTYKIFEQIKDSIPKDEFRIIDATIRMFTEPVLRLDEPKMRVYYTKVQAEKADALAELGLTKKDLGRDEVVAAKLRELGVEPEVKTTGKGNEKYAFAKTDQFMRDLLEDADERVSSLAAARLGIKSSLRETRCARLLSMSSRGAMAVYLRYCGAHTTRWSGGDSLNWQNFTPEIKEGIEAPPGHVIVVADSAQIECRVVNYLAGQWDVIEMFRQKRDPYVVQASQFYGRTITKADKVERHLGKTIELGCGFGMGAERFKITCANGPLGGAPIHLSLAEAKQAVDIYRSTHPTVKSMWYGIAEDALECLAARRSMTWGPLEIDDGAVWLPNGLPLWYDDPKLDANGDRWFLVRGRRSKMYGGKLVENVVQALARVILSQAMLRVMDRYRIVTCTHDEIACVVPIDKGQEALDFVLSTLKASPDWGPNLPLDAEGFTGVRYSK